MSKKINGFSKLSKSEKINWITKTHFKNSKKAKKQLENYWNANQKLQNKHDEFIENTLSNFYLPLSVAPNFLINDSWYTLPMVIEESSVVAAASNSAKFWSIRGGFKTEVLGTLKMGHVHFLYKGDSKKIETFFKRRKIDLLNATKKITKNMEERGGGIVGIDLIDKTDVFSNYYQLQLSFETLDAMGANFINTCLELIASKITYLAKEDQLSTKKENAIEIIMSIISNYVPESLVRAEISCPVDDFILKQNSYDGQIFSEKIINAINIAKVDPYRAVTHNKGIMNGVDALIMATGNDFRSVEAGVHAFACSTGQYRPLSDAYIKENHFFMELKIPLAIGTVGGLTKLHPMVDWSMEMLGYPSARELMQIIAAAGLAQNFAALWSLVTSGIQKGHMKMHLLNILNQFEATEDEKNAAINYFKNKLVSFRSVEDFLKNPQL